VLLLFVAFLDFSTDSISKCDFGWFRLVSDCGFMFHFEQPGLSAWQFCSLSSWISVIKGYVSFYLTMQWALSCSLCYTEFGYLSLWQDGIACSWLQMFARHKVKSAVVAAMFLSLARFSW